MHARLSLSLSLSLPLALSSLSRIYSHHIQPSPYSVFTCVCLCVCMYASTHLYTYACMYTLTHSHHIQQTPNSILTRDRKGGTAHGIGSVAHGQPPYTMIRARAGATVAWWRARRARPAVLPRPARRRGALPKRPPFYYPATFKTHLFVPFYCPATPPTNLSNRIQQDTR